MQGNGFKHYESDEETIDLHELWHTLMQHKLFVMLFGSIATSFVLLYLLSIPNVYESKALFVPQEEKTNGLGGLSAVASFAGVSVGEGGMTPDKAYESLLHNYAFMKSFVEDNNLTGHYLSEGMDENYVFAMGFRTLYDLTHSTPEKNREDPEKDVYGIVKKLQANISISADKKSGLITIGFQDPDRFLAKKVLNLFLAHSSCYLIDNKLESINRKLDYYREELGKTEGFELRKNISFLTSKLLEEKISTKSSRYFQVEILTKPDVAYVKQKLKPKRGLILAVTFVTSLMFAVFIVFIRVFLGGHKEKASDKA
jgi:uncharacterized protein involved in exopolysaccharide biosynthesis